MLLLSSVASPALSPPPPTPVFFLPHENNDLGLKVIRQSLGRSGVE